MRWATMKELEDAPVTDVPVRVDVIPFYLLFALGADALVTYDEGSLVDVESHAYPPILIPSVMSCMTIANTNITTHALQIIAAR